MDKKKFGGSAGLGRVFLNLTSNAQYTKVKLEKLYSLWIQIFALWKVPVKITCYRLKESICQLLIQQRLYSKCTRNSKLNKEKNQLENDKRNEETCHQREYTDGK